MLEIYRPDHRRLASTIALVAVMLTTACASRPIRPPEHYDAAIAPAAHGALARFVAELQDDLGGDESAYRLVASSTDALEARLALFDSAQVSLDVQYFIWQDDATGFLLLQRVVAAADRGVRVRLLVDDVSVFKQDRVHAALAKHPNIAVRTFNPWRARTRLARGLEFIRRHDDLNHRLHNKTIVADGRMALLGGRNIGDRYFGIYDVFVQNDLDVLFAGPMVDRAIANFDEFWNSPLSIPIDAHLRPRRNGMALEELRQRLAVGRTSNANALASFSVDRTDWTDWFTRQLDAFAAGPGEFIADIPELPHSGPRDLAAGLLEFIASTRSELVLSTAYLIPDDALLTTLIDIAARGARVVVLTNSIQSNNHMLAHVAYKRSRRELVRAGIELYELKPDGPLLERYGVDPVEPGFMGLHSKAIVVDRRWAFVGTPNLDPRSLAINMESGVIVDSPALASQLRELILEAASPENAWRLVLDDRGGLDWTSADGTLERQPAKGFGQRIMQFIYMLLPIKNQA